MQEHRMYVYVNTYQITAEGNRTWTNGHKFVQVESETESYTF